jgi:pimeloyl-ACP methyl ester carboxylesterase
MPVVRTEVAELEYLDQGPPDGDVVVLVHGFPDDATTWDDVVDHLPDRLRVIRPNLRGVGRSQVFAADEEAGGAQVAALARDLLDLADALALQRFFLVGHDWGARTAHAATVLEPDRVSGLVTLSTAYGAMTHLTPPEQFREAEKAWYRYWMCTEVGAATFSANVEAFVRSCWRDWSPSFQLSPEASRTLFSQFDNPVYADLVIHYYRHGPGEAPGRPRYAADQERLDQWPAVTVPSTFLVGLDDGCEIPEASRGNARFYSAGYERLELPGVGHFIQRERPDTVAGVITAAIGRAG